MKIKSTQFLLIISISLTFLFFFSTRYIISNLNKEKTAHLFEAYQLTVFEQIKNTFQQIGNSKEIVFFLQQKHRNLTRIKSDAERRVQEIIIVNHLISGATLKKVGDKEQITTGKTSKLQAEFDLKYINHYLNKFGISKGTLTLYINEEAFIKSIEKNSLLKIYDRPQSDHFLKVEILKNYDFVSAKDKKALYIYEDPRDNFLWLIFILSLLILVSIFYVTLKKEQTRLTTPMKKILDTLNKDSNGDHIERTLSFTQENTDLIIQIISIQKYAITILLKKLHRYTEETQRKYINELHKLKSEICGVMLAFHSGQNIMNDLTNMAEKFSKKLITLHKKENIFNYENKINICQLSCIITIINEIKDEHKITTHFDTDFEFPNTYIHANAEQLKIIFENIFNNSIEAGATNIHIALKNENELTICLSDNGDGVAPNTDVFSGFSSKPMGSGFGLSNAKKYIRSVNGNIESLKLATGFGLKLSFEVIAPNLVKLINIITNDAIISGITLFTNDESSPLLFWQQLQLEDTFYQVLAEEKLANFFKKNTESNTLSYQIIVFDFDIYQRCIKDIESLVIKNQMSNQVIVINANNQKLPSSKISPILVSLSSKSL